MIRIDLYLPIFILILTVINTGSYTNATIGKCLPQKRSCSECYRTLKESLLKRDDNVRKLSEAFFPPRDNPPEFVKVTYYFGKNSTGENSTDKQVWFWSHESSYLFFPMETFQYLSLYFGKSATYFSREVTLNLDSECSEVQHDIMRLLTQRLKDYIQKASINPEIDNNYFARSEEDNYTNDYILSTNKAQYITAVYIAGTVLTALILFILLFIYYNTKRWDVRLNKLYAIKKANTYTQSKICSISILLSLINIYIVVLDGLALNEEKGKDSKLDVDVVKDRPKILFSLTCYMFAVNLFTFLTWIAFCVIGVCCCKTKLYLCLSLSTVGPILSLMIHLPYILIAYLNDATYATSIFIYYTILVFTLFGALDLSFGTCIGAIIEARNRRNENEQPLNNFRHRAYPSFYKCSDTQIIICFVFIIIIFATLIIVLLGMLAAALVVIPISSSVSDTPNRLLGFYQTIFVLGGAYLVYRNFFKKKTTLESVVKEKEDSIFINNNQNVRWEGLSNNEKVAEFYSHIVYLVANLNPNNIRLIPVPEQQNLTQDANVQDERSRSQPSPVPTTTQGLRQRSGARGYGSLRDLGRHGAGQSATTVTDDDESTPLI